MRHYRRADKLKTNVCTAQEDRLTWIERQPIIMPQVRVNSKFNALQQDVRTIKQLLCYEKCPKV